MTTGQKKMQGPENFEILGLQRCISLEFGAQNQYCLTSYTGLKITAGHRTISGQDDCLSGQNLGLAVILTGQVRGFQIIH